MSKYYIKYINEYYGILRDRYKIAIIQENESKKQKVLDDVRNNKFLSEDEKRRIIESLNK